MSSSLLKSFNFNKDKELVNSVLTDYDAFPDKKLLDKLRKIIIERLVDTEIPEGVNLNEFIDDEIDKCLEGYDLTNVERIDAILHSNPRWGLYQAINLNL